MRFLFLDGEAVLEEPTACAIIRYIRGYNLISSDSAAAKTYYHYTSDNLGSITHITDEDGNILNRYGYDAFGNFTQKEETIPNRFCYTGEQYDPITSQYYLRARFYNPVIGRFLNEDTYYGDGLNLYTYCHNNPVNFVDPSGHDDCFIRKMGKSGRNDSDRIVVTDEVIRKAMEDAPLQTQQTAVSKPVIQNYVDRIMAGETDVPGIKVDGNVIVDGNHRYIVGRITGLEIPTISWTRRPGEIIS